MNRQLHAAKRAKNDEFYTRLTDIEKEVRHYWEQLRGKVVYLNCDDLNSQFWHYFSHLFDTIGLKELIATSYGHGNPGWCHRLDGMEEDGDGRRLPKKLARMGLRGCPEYAPGDFRSFECIQLIQDADVVITNPPFSLFREYLAHLMWYDKKFLIIGNANAITYKEVFPLLLEQKMWVGVGRGGMTFTRPDGSEQTLGNVCWFTNLDHARRHEPLILTREYSTEAYPKYDNYDAINVDRVADIPRDYDGLMGVPITFMYKWCPEQFEMVDFKNGGGHYCTREASLRPPDHPGEPFTLRGEKKFARVLIKRRAR